jgi:ABC-2 type transport system ATP-binding protein
MDDIEALCSAVTIVATGRVVFSGPLGKLAAENEDLDYRLVTSDPDAARALISAGPDVRLIAEPGAGMRPDAGVLVVRAQTPALDALVVRLVTAGIALRELAPVVSPLEAAFLALTDQQGAGG